MNNVLKRFLCAFLCTALLLGCLGTASAAGKKKSADPDISKLFSSWYYVTDTIPEGMTRTEFTTLYTLYDQNYDNREDVQNCEVTFISGEEALKDAVIAELVNFGNGQQHYNLKIDNDALTTTGQAVFHILIETENLKWEEKDTLVVLDYNEYPLVETRENELAYDAQIGDSFIASEMMADAATINTADIASKVKFRTKLDLLLHYLDLDYSYEDYKDLSNRYDRVRDDIEIKRDYSIPNSSECVLSFVVKKYGAHHVLVEYEMGNVLYSVPVTLTAEGFAVQTYDTMAPGAKVQCEAYGSTKPITVTWSVEGENATINEETGLLKIDSSAVMGSRFTVKAVTSDGREASMELVLNDGALADIEYSKTRGDRGFYVPIPDGWYNDDFDLYYGEGHVVLADEYYGNSKLAIDAMVYMLGTEKYLGPLLEDPETAKQTVKASFGAKEDSAVKNLQTEWFDIDGHPALLDTFEYYRDGVFAYHLGILWYARNNRILLVRAFSVPSGGGGADKAKKISMLDMEKIAGLIRYEPDEAELLAADTEITVSSKGDPVSVSAGKSLQFAVTYANTKVVNKKNKNDAVNWSVVDAETGAEAEGITISEKGQLSVAKDLAAPVKLQVKAVSAQFGTSAEYSLTAMPIISKVNIEPAELFFYVGTDEPQTVKASLEPDTIPPMGLSWTPAKAGIVEISEVEDGVVSIKPLAAGKTTIAVKEPGGKNAKLTISVVEPVESLELTLKGNAKPGGSVAVTAALQPKQAGNKNLEWTLDVGEEIATINAKGQVKISKEAASGTIITVTCTALGAPEPIVSTIQIEIP